MRFTDALGNPVTSASTHFLRSAAESGTSTLPPCGWIGSDLPAMALADGRLRIVLWLSYREVADAVALRAAEIRVIASRLCPSDSPMPRKQGAALIYHQWRGKPDPADG